MSYKNTVKDYSQMIGFLTRDKTTDVPGSMAHGLRTGFYNGGRIPFEKGGPLTGEKFVEIVEKFPDYSNKQLLDYFNKNKFTNRYGEPLNLNVITTNKSKFLISDTSFNLNKS